MIERAVIDGTDTIVLSSSEDGIRRKTNIVESDHYNSCVVKYPYAKVGMFKKDHEIWMYYTEALGLARVEINE